MQHYFFNKGFFSTLALWSGDNDNSMRACIVKYCTLLYMPHIYIMPDMKLNKNEDSGKMGIKLKSL